MQQDGNRVEGSTVINAGGNVVFHDREKIVMILALAVIVISAINVAGFCFVVACLSIPQEITEPVYWLVAP